MSNVYVIDACSLINAAHNYNMNKKAFAHIWETLEDKIETVQLEWEDLVKLSFE